VTTAAPGRSRAAVVTIALIALLAASTVASAGIGPTHLTIGEVVDALRRGPGSHYPASTIVWSLRLPRIVLGGLIGACLALAGLCFQSVLRNDLADPYIIGSSSAANVGAEAVLLHRTDGWLAAALAAFSSALAATSAVYAFSRRSGQVVVSSLLLGGVVVGAWLGAVAALMLLLGPAEDTQYILGRLMGSLQDAELPLRAHDALPAFQQCGLIAVFLAVSCAVLAVYARSMDVYSLGEESAAQLGVDVERYKSAIIATGSLLTAVSVALAGIIGFVGLMVPHIARRLCGTPRHGRVIPVAAIVGGLILMWSDTLARSLTTGGGELPVGLVTAFLGAPFFLYLLRAKRLDR
jgi:iron complex transport system permease protein